MGPLCPDAKLILPRLYIEVCDGRLYCGSKWECACRVTLLMEYEFGPSSEGVVFEFLERPSRRN